MIRIHDHLTVLETEDELTLQELRTTMDLDRYEVLRLSPRAVLMDAAQTNTLVAALQRQGYTPKVTGA
jgi:hypothetical protein